jgi:two-component system response regulator FlrC
MAVGHLETSGAFKKNHAALANRLEGIASSLFPGRHLTVGDDSERVLSDRASTVSVSRGERPGLSRTASRARLAYADPMSEGTFAALIALLAGRSEPVAADPETLSVLAVADRLARTDIPVLINGPTGTGKEVLSRFIHNRSDRRDKPFVAVNCAAIPETMMEALLFGHQKGAFTGASGSNEGFCRSRYRPSCCARCRRAKSSRLARPGRSRSTCGSSPRPTATCRSKSPKAASAPTSTIASTCSR